MINILVAQSAKCLVYFAQKIEYILKKNKIECKIVHEYNERFDNGEDLYFVFWNHLHILPKVCIIYNMEPMVPHVLNSFNQLVMKSLFSKIIAIYDYTLSDNEPIIKRLLPDIPYYILNFGYSSFYHRNVNLNNKNEENIDIVFYGNVAGRRIQYVEELNKFAEQHGYKFSIYNYNLFNEEEKINIILSSKIVISFASADTLKMKCNDLARSSQVLSLGKFIITEKMGDSIVEEKMSKYTPHYSTIQEMKELIYYYLQNDEERQFMMKNAKDHFKIDFPFEKEILKIFERF